MDKMMRIVMMLTAVDGMSSVITSATSGALTQLEKLQAGMRKVRDGLLLMEAGKQGFQFLKGNIDQFAEMEAAGNRLKMAIARDGGILDASMYDKLYGKAQHLGEIYANNAGEYLDMMRILKTNGMEEADILGQIGEATEKLAVVLHTQPSNTAMFVAHMRRDMGVANKDMMGMMDLVARLHNIGVGVTGEDAISEMNQFFSKEGLSATVMQALGIEQAKQVSAIAGLFIRRGLSGQTVGTNFRRMLDSIRNPKAMGEVQSAARKYGIALDFFDKQHKFRGFGQMVAEFDKLKGLDISKIDAILKPFGGKMGLSQDFVALLAKEGVKDFNEAMHEMYKQADINKKVQIAMDGTMYKEKQLGASWRNLRANFGANLAPTYNMLQDKLKGTLNALNNFILAHPKLTAFVGKFIAIASAVLMAWGAFKLIQGAFMIARVLSLFSGPLGLLAGTFRLMGFAIFRVIPALISLGVQGAIAGWAFIAPWLPAIAVIGVIILLVYGFRKAIINHFGSVHNFLVIVWAKIKWVFSGAIAFLKMILWDFNPLVIIYANWGKIASWVSGMWDAVKAKFSSAVAWILGLGPRFMQAGANIIHNIYTGIVSKMHMVVAKIRELAQKIRSYFPFSPAKEGPLRDIHRIRLIETIAEAIQPSAILGKMKSVASAIFEFRPTGGAGTSANVAGGSNAGAAVVIHLEFAPVYQAAPGEAPGGSAAFMNWAKANSRQLLAILQTEMAKTARSSY